MREGKLKVFLKFFRKLFASFKKVTTFASPFGNGMVESSSLEIDSKIFSKNREKICGLKISYYLCNPKRKQGAWHQSKGWFF